MVVYGDVFTDLNLGDMIGFHQSKKSLATLAILKMPNPCEVGVVNMNSDGCIRSFVEKPPDSSVGEMCSGGIYVLNKKILEYVPASIYSDFAYDVFPRLLELDINIHGFILEPSDYLVDIGTNEKYLRVNEDIKKGKVRVGHG